MYKWLISYRMENGLKGQYIVHARSLAIAVLLAEEQLKDMCEGRVFITDVESVR